MAPPVKDVFEFLNKIDKEWEEYFQRNSTIDHIWYAWNNSFWRVIPSEKRIFIVCSGQSPFTKEDYEEFQEFKTQDGWTVELLMKHSELDCPGYCEVSKLFS